MRLMDTQTQDRFLRMKDVVEKTTLSRATIFRLVAKGSFPKQVRLSHRVAVWRESDVLAWMEKASPTNLNSLLN